MRQIDDRLKKAIGTIEKALVGVAKKVVVHSGGGSTASIKFVIGKDKIPMDVNFGHGFGIDKSPYGMTVSVPRKEADDGIGEVLKKASSKWPGMYFEKDASNFSVGVEIEEEDSDYDYSSAGAFFRALASGLGKQIGEGAAMKMSELIERMETMEQIKLL